MAPQVSEPVGPTDEGDMVASVMRPAVTTVDTRGHLAAAAYRMNHASQSALVVVDDVDRPVAMITERDLMRAVAHGAAPGEARIEDWMDRSPRTVRPETAMTEAAQIMLHTAQRHLPVVSDGRLEGIVAISDIADAFVGSVRLAAVVVFVSDLTRSLGFYQPLLRFTITVSDVDAALLTGPDGSQLYLHQVNDSSARRDDGCRRAAGGMDRRRPSRP